MQQILSVKLTNCATDVQNIPRNVARVRMSFSIRE